MKLSLMIGACAILAACGATQNSTTPASDAATAEPVPAAQVRRARLVLSTDDVHLDAFRGADFVPVTLDVRNEGDAETGPLSVSPLDPPLVLSSHCDGVRLAPGATCSITIGCARLPAEVPSSTAQTLTVAADPGGAAAGKITTTLHDLGALAIESGSFGVLRYWEPKSKRITIHHLGTEASGPLSVAGTGSSFLTLDQWNAPGAGPLGFAITADGCSGRSLLPGEPCFIVVTARFESDGERSATLHVTAPGANAASTDVSVSVRTSWVQLTVIGPSSNSVVLSGPDLDTPETFDATANIPIPTGIASTFHPKMSASSTFDGWSGDCAGTGDCIVTGAVDGGSAYVTATFH